jgi:hypothetical protein
MGVMVNIDEPFRMPNVPMFYIGRFYDKSDES